MKERHSSEKRFVVDAMMGKLCKWLRVLGFDALYESFTSSEQLDAYREEGYLFLTRNQRWCGKPSVFCLSSNDPMGQLREVISRVPITPREVQPLHRCILCNQHLQQASREQVFQHVPDYVFETSNSFHQCPECRKIYWPGSHSKRMIELLKHELGWNI